MDTQDDEITLYVHGRGDSRVETIAISQHSTVRSLANRVSWGEGSVATSIEDALELLELDLIIAETGLQNRSHVHVHRRCGHVHVTVFYNGASEHHKFMASTRVENVLKDALARFNIAAEDQSGWQLEFGNPARVAQVDLHLGDLPLTSECRIEFALGREVHVQG